jgi:hypothetical protein
MRIMRLVCCLALPVAILSGLGGLGGASAQQGSDAARQACTPDAMRLCSEFIPDAERVKKCMLSKRPQLSQECRVAMAAGGHGTRHHHHKGHRHHHSG